MDKNIEQIKLIVVDVDNTILPAGKYEISARLKEDFHKALDQGIKVMVNTGRHYTFLPPSLFRDLPMDLIGTINGACLVDHDGNTKNYKITNLFVYNGLKREETEEAGFGDIVALSGVTEANIGDTIADKKKVYFEIGAGAGLYTFGNDTFLNELIETVGATNICGEENSWITVTPEAVIDANPDVILANSPGTNEAGLTAIEDIESRDGWDTITAVQNGDVYSIDNNASSRPSQNVIKALKEIAKAIYPDEYKQL